MQIGDIVDGVFEIGPPKVIEGADSAPKLEFVIRLSILSEDGNSHEVDARGRVTMALESDSLTMIIGSDKNEINIPIEGGAYNFDAACEVVSRKMMSVFDSSKFHR